MSENDVDGPTRNVGLGYLKKAAITSVKSSAIHGMSPRDVYEFMRNFGLGCGIDATKSKPWEEKRSYRVCHIQENLDNIVITDEGGNMHAYHSRVESQYEIQGQLTSSIALPNTPVSIGAEAEMTRKSTSSCEIEGRKLVDCKVSIRPDSYKLSSSGDPDDFEARLSSWIMDQIHYYASVQELVQRRVQGKKPSDAGKKKGDQGKKSVTESPPRSAASEVEQEFMNELGLGRKASVTMIDLGLELFRAKTLMKPLRQMGLDSSAAVKLIELDLKLSEVEKLLELMSELGLKFSAAEKLFELMGELGLSVFKLQLAVASAKHKKEAKEAGVVSNKDHMINADWNLLVDLCGEFIRYFDVTHYVSAIELGASEFQIVEETTEESETTTSSSFSLSQIATATARTASKWRKFSKSTETRKLGFIHENGKEIERLAVLGVSVLPITDRLRTAHLRFAMQRALNKHIDHHFLDVDNQFKKGPFKIIVQVENSANHYLRVYWNEALPEEPKSSKKKKSKQKRNQKLPEVPADKDKVVHKPTHRSLQATQKEERAAPFFLIPVEGGQINEFYIVYYKEKLPFKGGRYIPPTSSDSVPYYLEADLDLIGQSAVGLKFVANPSKACQFRFKCSRNLELHNRTRSSILKFAQKESFYIKCPMHRGLKGYVLMYKLFEDSTKPPPKKSSSKKTLLEETPPEQTTPKKTPLHPTMGIASSKDTHNPPSLCFLFKLSLFTPLSINQASHEPDSVQDTSSSSQEGHGSGASLSRQAPPGAGASPETPVALKASVILEQPSRMSEIPEPPPWPPQRSVPPRV